MDALPREIIRQPDLQVYISDWEQKANYACKMYARLGFEVLEEKQEELIMVMKLQEEQINGISDNTPD